MSSSSRSPDSSFGDFSAAHADPTAPPATSDSSGEFDSSADSASLGTSERAVALVAPATASPYTPTYLPPPRLVPARPGVSRSAVPLSAAPLSAVPPAGAPWRVAPDSRWPDALWGEPPRPAASEEPIVDLGRLREVLGYPWRAVRRRRRLAGGVFAAVLGAAVLAALIAPRRYDVETSILAQRNFVMPALGNPRRSVPAESDAPTRLAAEAVLNRQNLLDIIDAVGLEREWARLRSPAGRAKDAVQEALHGPRPAEERRDVLVQYLRTQLWVTTDEGTVRIGVHFPDPRLALRTVQVAQRNFLEKRGASELSLIRESIGILETHVASAHDQIEEALAEVKQFTPVAARGSAMAGYAPAAAPRPNARPNPALAALERDLEARRAALAAAEGAHVQQVNTVQARLVALRATLGAAHPEVVAAQASLAALRGDSPELTALRTAARDAQARFAAAGGSTAVVRSGAPDEASLANAALVQLARQAADTLENPRLTYARSRLKIAVADYEDLLDRLEGARIELETARAAFKYRYSIITPAQLPTRPVKPNVPFVLAGGVVAAATLAVFAVLVVELGAGRLVEGWQVSRFVGLPVLGETPRA